MVNVSASLLSAAPNGVVAAGGRPSAGIATGGLFASMLGSASIAAISGDAGAAANGALAGFSLLAAAKSAAPPHAPSNDAAPKGLARAATRIDGSDISALALLSAANPSTAPDAAVKPAEVSPGIAVAAASTEGSAASEGSPAVAALATGALTEPTGASTAEAPAGETKPDLAKTPAAPPAPKASAKVAEVLNVSTTPAAPDAEIASADAPATDRAPRALVASLPVVSAKANPDAAAPVKIAALAAEAAPAAAPVVKAEPETAKAAKRAEGEAKGEAKTVAAAKAPDAAPARPAAPAATAVAAPPAPAGEPAPRDNAKTNLSSDAPDLRAEGARAPSDAASAAAKPAHAHETPRIDAAAIAALAARIAKRGADGATRFTLRLDPPEMGRVDVRLDVDADGRARAHLTVERPEALADLSRHGRALERALAQSGLDVAKDAVTFTLARDGSGGRHGGAMRDDAPTFSGQEHQDDPAAPEAPAASVIAAIETVHGFALVARGRVDVRA